MATFGMTDDQVDAWEKKLQDAQKLVESAGRDICSIQGVGDVWSLCTEVSRDISKIIGQQHRLRLVSPDTDGEE